MLAYNAEGYLRSRGVVVTVPPEGEKPETELWALVVGVSNYADPSLRLRFAAKDAKDFAQAVEVAAARMFQPERTHITTLTDPTREQVLAALKAQGKAKPTDIFVVFLAGHGVSHGDGFYFLTANATSGDLNDPAVREQATVSSAELTDLVNAIPATKQVLILDTCASGRFVEALTGKRSVPSSQVRALERVKDRAGVFVLAGCAADMVSYEATRFGQGLLTYSLLLGMSGAKLRQNQYVDVATLFGFAQDRVPEFARDIGGVQQPMVAMPKGGGSFDIGRITDEERELVRVRPARP